MKLAAKRMAQTLDATLVDDNRRPLDDAALAAIREQVQAHRRGAARGATSSRAARARWRCSVAERARDRGRGAGR